VLVVLEVDTPHHQVEPQAVMEEELPVVFHYVIVMYELVDEVGAYGGCVPGNKGVELDVSGVAAGPFLSDADAGDGGRIGGRTLEGFESAGTEDVVEILLVQLAVELGEMEGLLQGCCGVHMLVISEW
jgi:hypothetical protein